MKITATSRLRSTAIVDKWYRNQDGSRTLIESATLPEVARALRAWAQAGGYGVLIGGMALSYWARPRMTMDADFLFLSPAEIPDEVPGFKRIRSHAFQHNATHVEIEVLDANFLHMPHILATKIVQTAVIEDGMRIASREGLIAAKLGRWSRRDQGDVEDLVASGSISFRGWPLSDTDKEKLIPFGIAEF